MIAPAGLPANRALLERLRHIDFMVEHFGCVKRRFLIDYYGISMPQASLDLRAYMAAAPGNIDYDKGARMYRRTPAYQRKFP